MFAPYGTAERLGGRGSGISAKKIQKCCEKLCADPLFKIQVFCHNFTKSARIELRFWEVANLEKLNNFYLGHFESLLTKKWLFCSFGFYLARARARARPARPPRAGGPGLPHVQKRQVKQVLPRARVEIWRSFARAGRACCDVQAFDFHRISFAVEAPPVSALSHMADFVASDLLIFIER